MIDSIPFLAQYKSWWVLIWGNIIHGKLAFDVEGALKVNRNFIDTWANHKLEFFDELANGTPIVGQIKGKSSLLQYPSITVQQL